MNYSAAHSENQTAGQETPGVGSTPAPQCPVLVRPGGCSTLSSDLCGVLAEAGCPLAPLVQERLRFEELLAELSATFVNLPASQVDSQIESALRRLVEFLRSLLSNTQSYARKVSLTIVLLSHSGFLNVDKALLVQP